MKFNIGDRIQVKDRWATGTVMAFDLYLNHDEDISTYTIQWDHYHSPLSYMASDAEELWEKLNAHADALKNGTAPVLPSGNFGAPIVFSPFNPPQGYNNNYVPNPPVLTDGSTYLDKEYDKLHAEPVKAKGCGEGIHDWTMYHGIYNNFEYCKVCDKKKE